MNSEQIHELLDSIDTWGTELDPIMFKINEYIEQIEKENKQLKEQVKVAVHQGMDGAKAGYEEVIERQRQRINSLEEVLLWVINLVKDDFGETTIVKDSKNVLNADWR